MPLSLKTKNTFASNFLIAGKEFASNFLIVSIEFQNWKYLCQQFPNRWQRIKTKNTFPGDEEIITGKGVFGFEIQWQRLRNAAKASNTALVISPPTTPQ